MIKQCPKCGRTSPPALVVCPRCKTPFNASVADISGGHRQVGKMRSEFQEASDAGKSRKAILIIAITVVVIAAVVLGVFHFFGQFSEIKRKGQQLTQKLQGREWKYPPGDAAETARVMSVQQLIEAWETVPDRSQKLIHATYAKAMGLKGREASVAIKVLSPYVTDADLYLRQGAMEGLAGIGDEGLPHILRALNYWNKADSNAVTIRWDAAMAIARMGPRARNADKDLLAAIINPEENPNVKGEAAVALAGIGNDAVPSLNKARCYFYDQNGTSVAETGVLRTINIALQNMNASTGPCKGLEGQQASSAPASVFVNTSEISRMQVPELLDVLRKDVYHTREIADELVKRGAREQAVEVLNLLLRDKDRAGSFGIKMALEKLGAHVTYAREKNSFFQPEESKVDYIEWSVELKGDSIYSSGRIYLGSDIVAGFSRQQKGMVTLPSFARYQFTLKGGKLAQPIEKTFEVQSAGEKSWEDVIIASGLGTGKYTVSLFLHAQYVKEDGGGQILNNSAGFLEVQR